MHHIEDSLDRMQRFIDGFELCIIIPLAMITTFLLIFLCIRVIVMFCCTRAQRKKAAEKISGSLRKHDSGPMFARLEEFDVLTPLQATPAASIASGISIKNYGSSSPSTSSGSDSRIQLIPPILSSSSSDSPPPPRRPIHGKTLIVPLNASRYRTPMTMNIAGTPDSRLTSFECGTTKSCATIPEDDEDEMNELLSIDRTSLSVYEQPSGRFGYSAYNLTLPQPTPEFQLPAPTYSPPELPSESPATKPTKIDIPEILDPEDDDLDQDPVSVYEFSRVSDPNSPHSSSNSFSDSFYLNNFDVISSAANSQIFEASLCGESDVASKFQLHRIEEESENGDEQSGTGVGQEPQINSITSSTSQFFPRSISQQFDMMRLQ